MNSAARFNAKLNFGMEPEALAATQQPTHVLVSSSLRHSHTFALYAELLAQAGSSAVFLPFEVQPDDLEKLRRLLTVFRHSPTLGSIMVSNPWKQRARSFLDVCTERATAASAVNLLRKAEGKLIGDNLDGVAFEQGLQDMHGISLAGRSVLFLGCGGVSSAIATLLGPQLSRIGLSDTDHSKAEVLQAALQRVAPDVPVNIVSSEPPRDLRGYDVLYNGTGLGKGTTEEEQEQSPLLDSECTTASLFLDAVYTPAETRFLRQGARQGSQCINGLSHMLLSTTLHCSMILSRSLDWQTVRKAYEQLIGISSEF